MTLSIYGQPLPLVFAVGACMIVFILSFFAALYATLVAGSRTGAWRDGA